MCIPEARASLWLRCTPQFQQHHWDCPDAGRRSRCPDSPLRRCHAPNGRRRSRSGPIWKTPFAWTAPNPISWKLRTREKQHSRSHQHSETETECEAKAALEGWIKRGTNIQNRDRAVPDDSYAVWGSSAWRIPCYPWCCGATGKGDPAPAACSVSRRLHPPSMQSIRLNRQLSFRIRSSLDTGASASTQPSKSTELDHWRWWQKIDPNLPIPLRHPTNSSSSCQRLMILLWWLEPENPS